MLQRNPSLGRRSPPAALKLHVGANAWQMSAGQAAFVPAPEANVRGEQVVEAEIGSEVPDLN